MLVSTTKLIVGHKHVDQSYGTHSPGPMFDVLVKVVAKVSCGDVDVLLQKLSESIEVTKRSRRRPRTVARACAKAA